MERGGTRERRLTSLVASERFKKGVFLVRDSGASYAVPVFFDVKQALDCGKEFSDLGKVSQEIPRASPRKGALGTDEVHTK